MVIVPPVGETDLRMRPVAVSYVVAVSGAVVPTPPVVFTEMMRPASSVPLVVVRVELLAVSVILAGLPHQSYSVVLVGSCVGLDPPPVIAPAGPVEQTRSVHSGRPAQAPVPLADQ